MMEITEEFRAWIDRNAGMTELAADEYIDSADGLIHYVGRETRQDQLKGIIEIGRSLMGINCVG